MSADLSTCLAAFPLGYTLQNTYFCKPCSANCMTCNIAGSVPVLANSDSLCHACPKTGCAKCNADSFACVECEYPKYLQADLSCGDCPGPKVSELNRTCPDCNVKHCRQCEAITRCTVCEPLYRLTLNKSCEAIYFKALSAVYAKKDKQIPIDFEVSVMLVQAVQLAITGALTRQATRATSPSTSC